ncbi:MAG: ribosome biogenesis GTPase Der [Gemmatimonadales bacterium]|jgi:GTP-binding protein|nr:ribosome biogenesis GTPase Der [Gemmatimonadales bacterium]MDZ4258458.1 ribosome biogenesis GTPase Der [Gemmatimonadales bacterium]MDZ4388205.1 ribosome biogenesis GTPase Der [Gemmatimonadales bacterium]
MSKPTVAIVGRPNVGKSTLFNRLVGGRNAIVSAEAGTTRDRHFGDANWNGVDFWLVDTGGLVPDSQETMDKAIREQVDRAVAEADLVLFLADGKEGLNPVDADIGRRLRQSKRPVILAVNKLDELALRDARHAFHELGLGEPFPVSAQSGQGTGDLLDELVLRLPEHEDGEEIDRIRVAVVGRPNAGKSSLVNKLLGEERLVVTPIAGTTRDAIDSDLSYHGKTLTFVDTAGLRRHAKVDEALEFYSTMRTERAIERADVCVLVVDAERGMHNQDLRIATRAWDAGCGLVIVVNKWDLIPDKDANTAKRGEEQLTAKAPFLEFVPFIYTSALSGQRVRNVLDLVLQVAAERLVRIPTARVNEVLRALVDRNAPPQAAGEAVKLLYASQIETAPPTFAIITNRPDAIHESYQRFLVRGFRKAWGFLGCPIRMRFNRRGSKA